MKILKLLQAILLLNCIVICEAASTKSISLYVALDPSFFKTDLVDLRCDIEKK